MLGEKAAVFDLVSSSCSAAEGCRCSSWKQRPGMHSGVPKTKGAIVSTIYSCGLHNLGRLSTSCETSPRYRLTVDVRTSWS